MFGGKPMAGTRRLMARVTFSQTLISIGFDTQVRTVDDEIEGLKISRPHFMPEIRRDRHEVDSC